MKPRVTLEAVYHDADLIEVRITASNASFSGAVCVYVARGDLARAAKDLTGFPRGSSDVRRIKFGPTDQRLGCADLSFRCRWLAAHAELQVQLRSGDECRDEPGQAVTLTMALEATAVDQFVTALLALEGRGKDTAVLEGAA